MDGDADEVGSRLCDSVVAGVRRLGGLGRRRAVDRRHVGDPLQLDIRGADGAKVATRPRVGHPGRRWILALGIQHVELVLRRAVEGLGEVGPVGKRESLMCGAVRSIEEIRVAYRLTVTIRIDARQGAQDVSASVRDQWRVVIVEHGAIADEEVVEARHLLDVGRDIRIVAPEVDVVELELDDMLDRSAFRIQLQPEDGCAARAGSDVAAMPSEAAGSAATARMFASVRRSRRCSELIRSLLVARGGRRDAGLSSLLR